MEIKITPRYNPDRSYPEENKFFFEYDMEIITDKPIQFLEYELKMRCGGKEHEFYADHIHTEKPYIKGYYKTTRFIPSDFPHASYSEGMIEVVSLHVNGISIGHIRTNNVENTIYYSDGQ
jgi:hypothetical protein